MVTTLFPAWRTGLQTRLTMPPRQSADREPAISLAVDTNQMPEKLKYESGEGKRNGIERRKSGLADVLSLTPMLTKFRLESDLYYRRWLTTASLGNRSTCMGESKSTIGTYTSRKGKLSALHCGSYLTYGL